MEFEIKTQSKIWMKTNKMLIQSELSKVGKKYNAVDLAWGAPYLQPPRFLIENLIAVVNEGHNGYAWYYGHPDARKLIAEFYSPMFKNGVTMDDVMISNGANGWIASIIQAICSKKEDEVIIIEPFYPKFQYHTQMTEWTVRSVPLVIQNEQWVLDLDILKETLNKNTRLLILNTPHNPTGKVFTIDELQEISDILEEYPQVWVLSDEAYHFITFDGHEHHSFANIKDNYKKTVTVYSGGKMLCCWGWRVGWCLGPPQLLEQAVVFNEIYFSWVNVPGQLAVARSLKTAFYQQYEGYPSCIEYQNNEFKMAHDAFIASLKDISLPMKVIPANGCYFVFADISECRDLIPEKYFRGEEYEIDPNTNIEKHDFGVPVPIDVAIWRWFATEKHIIAVPGSLFYSKDSNFKSNNYIRFGFCNGLEKMEKAIQHLS